MTETLINIKKKPGHLPYLDSLRGLAAIYVVIHHIINLHPYYKNTPIFVTLFNQVFSMGHYAVDFFIILSGFCLMLPVIQNGGKLSKGVIIFFKKRVIRILPPYYLSMGLSLLLIATVIGDKTGTIWDDTFPVTREDLVTHLILIQHIFSDSNLKINYVFWSISVECEIYLLFPLILIAWRKFGGITTNTLVIILSHILFFPLVLLHLNTTPLGACPHYLGLFTLGMLAAEVSFLKKYAHLIKKLHWGLIALIFAGVATIVSNLIYSSSLYTLCDLTAGLCFFCLLISVTTNSRSWLCKILLWKPLVFFGTFAYSTYLIHAPIIQLLYQYIILPLNLLNIIPTPILSSLMTIFIIPISYIFFLVCEKPFLAMNLRYEKDIRKRNHI